MAKFNKKASLEPLLEMHLLCRVEVKLGLFSYPCNYWEIKAIMEFIPRTY
jgi:hypothetical protein